MDLWPPDVQWGTCTHTKTCTHTQTHELINRINVSFSVALWIRGRRWMQLDPGYSSVSHTFWFQKGFGKREEGESWCCLSAPIKFSCVRHVKSSHLKPTGWTCVLPYMEKQGVVLFMRIQFTIDPHHKSSISPNIFCINTNNLSYKYIFTPNYSTSPQDRRDTHTTVSVPSSTSHTVTFPTLLTKLWQGCCQGYQSPSSC